MVAVQGGVDFTKALDDEGVLPSHQGKGGIAADTPSIPEHIANGQGHADGEEYQPEAQVTADGNLGDALGDLDGKGIGGGGGKSDITGQHHQGQAVKPVIAQFTGHVKKDGHQGDELLTHSQGGCGQANAQHEDDRKPGPRIRIAPDQGMQHRGNGAGALENAKNAADQKDQKDDAGRALQSARHGGEELQQTDRAGLAGLGVGHNQSAEGPGLLHGLVRSGYDHRSGKLAELLLRTGEGAGRHDITQQAGSQDNSEEEGKYVRQFDAVEAFPDHAGMAGARYPGSPEAKIGNGAGTIISTKKGSRTCMGLPLNEGTAESAIRD